jgi:ribosomal protein S21
MRKNNKFNNRRQRPLEPCVTVHAEECNGDPEKMVRRFTKKVKREGIIEEAFQGTKRNKPGKKRGKEKNHNSGE